MAEQFKDHFSAIAGGYAEFRPVYPRELFAWLAEAAAGRERAWDCATGNGQAAVRLAAFFQEVIATDASSGQIARAQPQANVTYQVAPAEASGLPASSTDLITVAQALHWFDFDRFYAEARRVLRPGGLLAVWCYGGIEFEDPQIQEQVDHFYHQVVGPYWPPERRYIEEKYRSIPFPFADLSVPPFAMAADLTLDRFLGYLRTWSATQRFIQARGFDPVNDLAATLGGPWPADQPPKSRWPIHLRAGRPA